MSNNATKPEWVQCIELAHGRSWCGQRIKGFFFASLDHAAQSGVMAGRMVACSRCVDAALKALRAGAPPAQPACWIDRAELRNIAMEGCTPSVSAKPVSEFDVPLYTQPKAALTAKQVDEIMDLAGNWARSRGKVEASQHYDALEVYLRGIAPAATTKGAAS